MKDNDELKPEEEKIRIDTYMNGCREEYKLYSDIYKKVGAYPICCESFEGCLSRVVHLFGSKEGYDKRYSISYNDSADTLSPERIGLIEKIVGVQNSRADLIAPAKNMERILKEHDREK